MIDEYLEKEKSFLRLESEYNKYGSLHIGYDFDNTVYDFHKTGQSYDLVIQLLIDLKKIGCKLTCWTAQKDLVFVNQYLKDNDIPFDDINGNGINIGWSSRKPFFSALLDDRAGLLQVYTDLSRLVIKFKNKSNE